MKKPRYLKHPANGRVLPWTQILAERGDMIPCDSEGNPLAAESISQTTVASQESIYSSSKAVDLGDPKKRRQFEQKLDDEIKKTIAENARRKTLPYDGVMGVLPEWVPERDRSRFEEERTLLLHNYSHQQILEFLELFPRDYKEQKDVMQYINNKLNSKEKIEDPAFINKIRSYVSPFNQGSMHRDLSLAIDYLIFIKKAVNAGPPDGLRMLAGENAARGYKIVSSGREGGKAKGEVYSPEKERLRKIAKQIVGNRRRNSSKRNLACLVIREAYPDLEDEDV